MKTYIVNHAFCYKDRKTKMTEEEYNKWIAVNANAYGGFYRVVGEEASGHYYVDFDQMWEVTVVDANNQKQIDKATKVSYNIYI